MTIPYKPVAMLTPNENLYMYLTVPYPVEAGTRSAMKSDFEKIKVVGTGGFSKVYKSISEFMKDEK